MYERGRILKSANQQLRRAIKGINVKVPLAGKGSRQYINFDNAASTPPLQPVLEETGDFFNWYSGVHRGTGYKSLISSRIYDECHDIIGRFVGADLSIDSVVMVKNTTEAINKLSYRLGLHPRDVVIITDMEHHSNELPWRARAQVRYARINSTGQLDLDHVETLFKQNRGRVKLLSVCGASNVTGHINQVYTLAKMAHFYGSPILVDGAQLVPHQRFDMKPASRPDHIDYLAFSGHKIFAPYGSGVLIGPRATFTQGIPEYQGGGTIKLVLADKIYWADPPDKEEAGSANVMGAYALAKTLQHLVKMDMTELADYEAGLTDYALDKLGQVPSIQLYGSKPRVGVISFNLTGMHHAMLGAVLCYEAAIGLRTGCFCAQNYVRQLLGIDPEQEWETAAANNELYRLPGMVRISLAAYNTKQEIDYLSQWLTTISENAPEFRRRYRFSAEAGGFIPTFMSYRDFIDLNVRRCLNVSDS